MLWALAALGGQTGTKRDCVLDGQRSIPLEDWGEISTWRTNRPTTNFLELLKIAALKR